MTAALVLGGLSFFGENLAAQQPADLMDLSRRISTGTVEEKRDALFQIRNLETSEASAVAVPALTDQSDIVRATAVYSVIFLEPDQAVRLLMPLLNDKSIFVRRETALALGQTGAPQAAPVLIQTLRNDKKTEVRAAAALALGRIGDISAIEPLTAVLRKKPSEKEEFLRRSAARSIGQIAQFIQTDKMQLTTPVDFLPEKYQIRGNQKYQNLVKEFPVFKTSEEVLIRSLRNNKEFEDVRRETAFALGAIGDPTAAAVLQQYLDSEDYYLAEICEKALTKFSGSNDQ